MKSVPSQTHPLLFFFLPCNWCFSFYYVFDNWLVVLIWPTGRTCASLTDSLRLMALAPTDGPRPCLNLGRDGSKTSCRTGELFPHPRSSVPRRQRRRSLKTVVPVHRLGSPTSFMKSERRLKSLRFAGQQTEVEVDHWRSHYGLTLNFGLVNKNWTWFRKPKSGVTTVGLVCENVGGTKQECWRTKPKCLSFL